MEVDEERVGRKRKRENSDDDDYMDVDEENKEDTTAYPKNSRSFTPA